MTTAEARPPSSAATPARFTPSQARATVREARGRLTLHVWAQRYDTRRQLVEDLRRTFPGHGDRTWRKATGTWSFPPRHRARLLAWAVCWLEPEAIDWAPPPAAAATPRETPP